MAENRKKARVIGEALARAMFDMPLFMLRPLNSNGFDHSSAMEIARRMVRELDHAGWQVKEAGRRNVMKVEDAITLALSMTDCQRLASQSPEWTRSARVQATKNICIVLGWYKVVLVHRTRGSSRCRQAE